MSESLNIAPQELDTINSYWEWLGEEQRKAAERIVPLLRAGNIFKYNALKGGNIPLYTASRGTAIGVSGSAEAIESGAAHFEGQVFESSDEPVVAVVKLRNHLVFPTGHVTPYQDDRLSVEQVSGGLVDFDNPCLDIRGTVYGSTPIMRLEAQPVLIG